MRPCWRRSLGLSYTQAVANAPCGLFQRRRAFRLISKPTSEIERQLLRHYRERERTARTILRSYQHQRLLALGYIREQNLNIRELMITLTPAGHAALETVLE